MITAMIPIPVHPLAMSISYFMNKVEGLHGFTLHEYLSVLEYV